ncbi:putative pentatricopeptide repeat-containing protein At5g37570 [Argentina anserina]|uniref:putative pentatricopeptide repeat-containing protein At5g37570 n=1 Tax=Argentina anserina TaxID=57926 RepID=UPI00217692A0|nr:putative pentatricopeptide repeat-containing protein At5g37570 [Potentilla anserina]
MVECMRILKGESSVLTLLKACKTQSHLRQLHALIIRKGLDQHHVLISQLISLSFLPSYSTAVFNHLTAPTTYLWNSLLRSHCETSTLSSTLSLFIRMKRGDAAPDRCTYPSLVKACAAEGRVKEGSAVHASAVRCGVGGDVYVGTCLVDLYGKCGEVECARKVFDEMSTRNVVTWTALVVGYAGVGDMAEAMSVFDEMPARNVVSWNSVIRGFVGLGDMRHARRVFDRMPGRNVVSVTTMIDGYAKCGDMTSARVLFEQVPVKDVVMWSALISGYVQNGMPEQAVEMFVEMSRGNVKPDEFVVVSLMSACSQVGSFGLAEWVDSYLSNSSINICSPHVLAALIDMNAKCGNMERAMSLFDIMPKRDLITYCSMTQGLSIHGRGKQAVALFNEMLSEGLAPDEVAFTVILTACSRSELVEEGWYFFELMRGKYSMIPSPEHYACMVDLLGRSGQLKEAYELLQSMHVEPHAGAWGALLGACKLHCNVELGQLIANRLFVLQPENAGTYVLLSDINADFHRWLDVSVLRNKMNERGIKKIPGISSINLEG